jgi:alkaline phosphatase D
VAAGDPPDLQAAHASVPFVMSYDDHEVDENWAGDISAEHTPPGLFLLCRAVAFQAWYEHMPMRKSQLPRGPDLLAYRPLFRSDQPCGDGVKADCREALDPNRTMLGDTEGRWHYDGFQTARARWIVFGQQVMVMRHDRDPDPAAFATSMDEWDGAVAARDRLFAAVEAAKLPNLVVLTGDIHNHWAGELKKNFDDPGSVTLGVEFVATSISSGGDGFDTNDSFQTGLAQNPHMKFFNNQLGNVRHVVTPERWQADFEVLDCVSSRDGQVSTRQSFVVEHGRNSLASA